MFCSECGAKAGDSDQFCSSCGHNFTEDRGAEADEHDAATGVRGAVGLPLNEPDRQTRGPEQADEDPVIWAGQPSQLTHLKNYLCYALVSLAILAVAGWLLVKCWPEIDELGEFLTFPLLALFFVGLFGLLPALGKAMELSGVAYTVTSREASIGTVWRFIEPETVIELRGIKEVQVRRPLLLRLFSLGHLTLVPSQAEQEPVVFLGVAGPEQLASQIRTYMEKARAGQTGIRSLLPVGSGDGQTGSEMTVWFGRPSQLINIRTYAKCALVWTVIIAVFGTLTWYVEPVKARHSIPVCAAFMFLFSLPALKQWVQLRCHVYEVTNQRTRTETGVFSKRMDTLELYRVKDAVVHRPFFLRLFSLGDIHLIATDRTSPMQVLRAVPDPEPLSEKIRTYSRESWADRGGQQVEVST